MKNEIPTRTVHLTLKQVNPADLNEVGAEVFKQCFRGYIVDMDETTPTVREGHEKWKAFVQKLGIADYNEADLTFSPKSHRRFAGETDFPRGRYFTVCKNSAGDDNGTLVNEITAYAKRDKGLIFDLFDTTCQRFQSHIDHYQSDSTKKSLVVVFPPIQNKPHPFAATFTDDPTVPFIVQIPLRVHTTQLHKVIDLRIPRVAEWFAKIVSSHKWNYKGHPFPAFPLRPPIHSFKEILPALLNQNLGGSGQGVTQIAGLLMRQLRVDALIFPSARCDAYVKIKNTKMEDFNGWNVVTYKWSPSADFNMRIDWRDEWPKQIIKERGDIPENPQSVDIIFGDIKLDHIEKGQFSGSWTVQNLELVNKSYAVHSDLCWLLRMKFKDDDEDFVNVSEFAGGALNAPPAYRLKVSKTILNALLGDRRAINQLYEWRTETFNNGHHKMAKSLKNIYELWAADN